MEKEIVIGVQLARCCDRCGAILEELDIRKEG